MLVFLHGTTIMHPSAIGRTRAERVEQVRRAEDPGLRDYGSYVPVGDAVAKLRRWQDQGAEIVYLSSHRNPDDVALDASVLERFGFPQGRILARRRGESYGDIAGREMPDLLIEDDCESTGASEITFPQIAPELRARITSIIVPEFGGLDHLPDALSELLSR
ncbi:MAG TPA: hypothetical protein VFL27_12975 [Candidatus Dormibacteraeota bacterium]|nr:hypothetical protein [Candidatus Dormibacteraeota bacterium]